MERWQRDYVTKNLSALIADTKCSVALLAGFESSRKLSKQESERLGSNQLTNNEKSKLLYDLLMGRTKAYEVTTKLLFENNQSGAFLILLKGFQTVNITNPFEVCGIRLNVEMFRNSMVEFQGKSYQVSDLCKGLDAETLQQILQSSITSREYADIYHKTSKGHNFVLAKNTIPDENLYYIPRTMWVRNYLDPKIFSHPNCDDIFILQGLERNQLTTLASNHLTASSKSQLTRVTVRFILLETEAHLQLIVRNIQVPAHFIVYDKEKDVYIHRKTWGNSNLIWSFRLEKRRFMSEDEFLSQRESNDMAIACIYDTPGMGKSELLRSRARKLARNDPHRIVIYTEIRDLVRKSWGNLTTQNAIQFLIDFIAPSNLARELLLKTVDPNKTIDLFLDSYDEVPLGYIEQTVKIMNILESVPNIRITMAARPHQIYDSASSELTLYSLVRFTEEQQQIFLTKYWLNIYSSSDMQHLQEIAKYTLDTFKGNLKIDHGNVVGLPLLCYLLGDICAKDIYDHKLLESKIQSLDTTHDIFCAFFENRLRFEKVGKIKVIQEHTCLAFREIFSSNIALDFQQLLNVQESNSSICNYGIMEYRACDYQAEPKFIHRTFAEYLVADWYSSAFEGENMKALKHKSQYRSLMELLYKYIFNNTHIGSLRDQLMANGLYRADNLTDSILFTFTHLTLNYFLNARLKHKSSFEYCAKTQHLLLIMFLLSRFTK